MNRKQHILIFVFWFTMLKGFASASSDSLFTVEIDDKQYILHQVEKGESLFAIAKRYKTSVSYLMQSNNHIKDTILQPGQLLKITFGTSIPDQSSELISGAIYHKVQPKETIFSISVKNNIHWDSIRAWNNLQSDTITIGQKLIIGWDSISNEKSDEDKIEISHEQYSNDSLHSFTVIIDTYFLSYSRYDTIDLIEQRMEVLKEHYFQEKDTSFIEITEKGAASWIRGNISFSSNNLFAMHRNAPRGTVIKVTNPMNNESVYVKVIGKLPDISVHKKCLLSLSTAAAKYLGVLDQLFQVKVSYYVNSEYRDKE